EVEYQCRSGYCGVCRLPLLAGAVAYDEPPLAYVGQSEVLPCCCTIIEPIRIECRAGRQGELPLEVAQQDLHFSRGGAPLVAQWRWSIARRSRAAAAVWDNAGVPSALLRVFSPQSGLTHRRCTGLRSPAFCMRSMISPLAGMLGECTS